MNEQEIAKEMIEILMESTGLMVERVENAKKFDEAIRNNDLVTMENCNKNLARIAKEMERIRDRAAHLKQIVMALRGEDCTPEDRDLIR